MRTAFFADASPIGKQIKIGGVEFRVVGLQEKIGSAGGQSQDRVAYIPATVFNRIYGPEPTMLVFARPSTAPGRAIRIFLGVWPAMKAARLDPVDALRYE